MGVRVTKTVNGKTRSIEIECADFDKFNEIVAAMSDESTDTAKPRPPIYDNVVVAAQWLWVALRAQGVSRIYEHVARTCQPDEVEDATASYAWWSFVIIGTIALVCFDMLGQAAAARVSGALCGAWLAQWLILKHTHRLPTRLTRQARYERALLGELAKLQRRHGDVLALAGDGDISEVDHAASER